MSLLQEILKWSEGLPPWQSDAIARLLAKQTLTTDDLDDLFAILKTAHGIPDPKARTAKPLTPDQIPAPVEAKTHVELRAMKNMRHVNAIANNQRLTFGPTGLTVIYGDNGSGKSGYSRVLKRACRARDQTEVIHPNAKLPAGKIAPAEADFEIAVNGVPVEVHWINGQEAPSALSSVAIFDSRCARAYLDTEDDFSYVPYGMDVFEGLAKTCTQLRAMVEAENQQFNVDQTAFAHLLGDTSVGKLISGLSAKTTRAEIEVLANLTPLEVSKHGELMNSLKENNPKQRANELRLRARRIASIWRTATEKAALVDLAVIARLRQLDDNCRTAEAAAALAALELKKGENLLPGTGGDASRTLFEAARKFALESHPGKHFPDLGVDTLCPLCQQPLVEGASRLVRLEKFIRQEAEKVLQACRAALAAERSPFAAHVMSLEIDDATHDEIQVLDHQLAGDLRAFEQTLCARKASITAALALHEWKDLDTEVVNPAARLKVLADRLNGVLSQ